MEKNRRAEKAGKAPKQWNGTNAEGRKFGKVGKEVKGIRKKVLVQSLLEGLLFVEIIAQILFEGKLFHILAPLLSPFYMWWRINDIQRKEQKRRNKDLLEMLRNLSSQIQVGYSLENAFIEVEKEMEKLSGRDAEVSQELKNLNQAVRSNVPVEQELIAMAGRLGSEDFTLFADILVFARHSGGSFHQIIEATVYQMGEKQAVDEEIQTITSGKVFEQRIMAAVPLAIIIYLKLGSPGYLAVFYEETMGTFIMVVCVVIYLVAFFLGKKVVDIRI